MEYRLSKKEIIEKAKTLGLEVDVENDYAFRCKGFDWEYADNKRQAEMGLTMGQSGDQKRNNEVSPKQ